MFCKDSISREAEREAMIKKWFDMWLSGNCEGIDDVFSDDIVYIESWGPEYKGARKIKHWFEEWNARGKVVAWNIKQYFHKEDQTVVEWSFANVMNDGNEEKFDGVSLIKWNNGKICFLKEFGCNTDNYDPYCYGDKPVFKEQKCNWF